MSNSCPNKKTPQGKNEKLNNSKEKIEKQESIQEERLDNTDNIQPRQSRVDPNIYQASIPDLIRKNCENIPNSSRVKEVFNPRYIDEEKLKEYLNFVKSISADSSNSNVGLVFNFNCSVEEKALHFLNDMNYSIIRAKFYLLFPTLLRFNQFHQQNPVEISEKEMEEKIEFFISQMQETKSTQLEKWKQELQELLSSRVLFSRLMSSLEQGRQLGLKNDIPDFLKEMYDKTTKFSKEIKRAMANKVKINILEDYLKQSLNYKIISNEMVSLEEGIERSKIWLQKINNLGPDTYNLKTLENLLNDYKNLPLEYENYNKLKRTLDEARDLLDRIPNMLKAGKTRGNVNFERLQLKLAREYVQKIRNLRVRCDEFDAFINAVESTNEVIETIYMTLEDEKVTKTAVGMQQLMKDLSTLPFIDKLQDRLQAYYDYYTVLERMRKNIYIKAKLPEVKEDLDYCRAKGYKTQELKKFLDLLHAMQNWYYLAESMLNTKRNFNIKQLLHRYEDVASHLLSENYLDERIRLGEELSVEHDYIDRLKNLQLQINQWKNEIKNIRNFQDMLNCLINGYTFGFHTLELNDLFHKTQINLRWIISSLTLIKKYDNTFRSNLINENQFVDFYYIINSSDKEMFLPQQNNYRNLNMLLNERQESIIESPEYYRLYQLKRCSDDWTLRTLKVLEQKSPDLAEIQGLIEEADKFPTEPNLKNQLNDINQTNIWICKSQAALAHKYDNDVIISTLVNMGIKELKEKLDSINDFDKKDVIIFYVNYHDQIYEMLKHIAHADIKLKTDGLSINYIQNLIQEAQNIIKRSENMALLEELEDVLKKGKNWSVNYQKTKTSDKKKIKPKRKKSDKDTNNSKDAQGAVSSSKNDNDNDKSLKNNNNNKNSNIEEDDLKKSSGEKSIKKAENANSENDHIEQIDQDKLENENIVQNQENAEENMKLESIRGDKSGFSADLIMMEDDKSLLLPSESFNSEQCLPPLKEDTDKNDKSKEDLEMNIDSYVIDFSDTKKEQDILKDKDIIDNDIKQTQTQRYQAYTENYHYFFKIALYVVYFYEGLSSKVPVDELNNLKNSLVEINNYVENVNSLLAKKPKLNELDTIINQGIKLKAYILEIERCKKLYRWGATWANIASQVIQAIPHTKQYFKKSTQIKEDQLEYKVAKNVNLVDYYIYYDDNKNMFTLISKTCAKFDEEILKLESEEKENEGKKWYSKREKKINRKFNDPSLAFYKSDSHLIFDEKPLKKTKSKASEEQKTKKRKAIAQLITTKKPKKISIKELIKNEMNLKEENPAEKYCICRKGHDNFSYMICCDKCNEWYHGECIGLNKSLYQKNIDFCCPTCIIRYSFNFPSELTDYMWNSYNRLEEKEFMDIVEEGEQIPLDLPEYEEIKALDKKIRNFLDRAELESRKGPQFEYLENILSLQTSDKVLRDLEKAQLDREREIQVLYTESLGFPVKLGLAHELMIILQKRDLATIIIKHVTGKNLIKNIKKFLAKDYSHLHIENDRELKSLYDRIRANHQYLQDKYEYSSKINDNLSSMLEQKKDGVEFARMLKNAEDNNYYIDKLDSYKKALDDLYKWENKVKLAIANKAEKSIMCDLQVEYQKYIRLSSKLALYLNEIIYEAEDWQKKALRFMNEGRDSGILESDLIAEGHKLRCKTPILNYLEERRAGNTWGSLPPQRPSNLSGLLNLPQ